jgi:uncharacterized repeat protein (TIGR02543 family)
MKKYSKVLVLVVFALLSVLVFASCENDNNNGFKVSFMDGDKEHHSMTVNGTDAVELPAEPTRDGYKFEGWFLDKDAWQTSFTSDYFIDNSNEKNVSVYAKWKRTDTYTVVFDSNGGNGVDSVTASAEESFSAPIPPIRQGYTFNGWYLDDKAYSFDKMPDHNITLYAKWTANTYTVTFEGELGDLIEKSVVITYDKHYSLPVPILDGYAFGGWTDIWGNLLTDSLGKSLSVWQIATDTDALINWNEIPYTRVDKNNNEISTGMHLFFGEYPQTIKANDVTITETKNTKG